ncbi:caspase family protein [Streptomyces sp. H23]|uniref:caspase family protein n=1 Tax=unclassified Streptomyces TaxID=2593676 RepID=UPI00106E3B97|nr:caspase family protein [Streptomyces sp. H23]
MAVLSDPARSRAVLIGAHHYSALENLPAVAANLEGLRSAFTAGEVWGLPPEACTVIPQPATAAQVLDTVRENGRLAEDTLVVYYAGHGLTDPHTDELYLALPDSDPEREYTSLRYEYVRRAVLDPAARARRTVVILDCCYSGRALLGQMSASSHVAEQTVVDGTCVITACAETHLAVSPPDETYTAFTGELITTLIEGIAGRPDPIDMESLYRHLRMRLSGKSRPVPQQRNRNSGSLIAIARNRAAAGADPVSSHHGAADAFTSRQRDAERRLAEMEATAERLRTEAEQLRAAELWARKNVAVAQQLAKALGSSPEPDFKPYWFAIPAARPLMSEDGSLEAQLLLRPGVWHLARGRRGGALIVETEEGVRGILLDATGLERGDIVEAEPVTGRSGRKAKARIRENLRHAEQLVGTLTRPPEEDFVPFWFAVPMPRPLVAEDDSSLTPFAELQPGTWYLAVAQHGVALVAQSQSGRRGLLLDTTGIQRG